MKLLLAIVSFCALVAGPVHAGTLNVAVLGSPATPAWSTEVQGKLLATGFFNMVDVIDLTTSTPSVGILLAYDAVLVYTDAPALADPVALGNNLADYVDLGRGVVIAVFANASLPFSGRFATDNYWGIQPAGQTQGFPQTLGTIYEPASPLLAGVTTFNGGSSSYMSTGVVHPAATVVADWSGGSPLVVRRNIGLARRVDLNFFPPSSDSRSDFWVASTDGDLLMANALVYTAQGGPVAVEATSWGEVKALYR